MKTLTTTLILMLSTPIFAQNTRDLIGDLSNQTGRSLYIRPTITDPTIQKYYISTEFKKAKVEGYENGNEYRYNGFTDNFEFLEKDEVLNLVKVPNLKLKFNHNESIFQYLSFKNSKGINEDRFLEILSNDSSKYVLYKSFEVSERVNDQQNSYKGTEEKKIIVASNYFIGIEGQITELPKSAKKITQLIGGNSEEITNSNKFNLKKVEDLIKLVDLLNK